MHLGCDCSRVDPREIVWSYKRESHSEEGSIIVCEASNRRTGYFPCSS